MSDSGRPRITHVAIRFRGVVHSLPAPNRHHHIIWKIVREDPSVETVDAREEDQGFLDEAGRYLNRKQALVSALVNGQVRDPSAVRGGVLYSEDVW